MKQAGEPGSRQAAHSHWGVRSARPPPNDPFLRTAATREDPTISLQGSALLREIEKGSRLSLKTTIGVSNAIVRIMAKAMVISIRPLLAKLVSPDQKAFQAGKLIVENTQLVQDYIAWADELMEWGFLLFCDQDNAMARHSQIRIRGEHQEIVCVKNRPHYGFSQGTIKPPTHGTPSSPPARWECSGPWTARACSAGEAASACPRDKSPVPPRASRAPPSSRRG